MKETDRRYQRTHKLIRECFEEMFLSMEYADITVSALSARANINRKTFYHHYPALDDVLGEMLGEIVGDIMAYLDATAFRGDTLCLDNLVTGFFRLLNERLPLHKRILCSPECYSVFQRSADMLLDNNLQRIKKYLKPDDFRQKAILIFISHSVLPIYREWLLSEPDMTEQELGALIEGLMLHGAAEYLPLLRG